MMGICSLDYGQKKALIWGDSHADHYSPALDEWARYRPLPKIRLNVISILLHQSKNSSGKHRRQMPDVK